MVRGLGNKLQKSFSTLGQKTNKITTSIGNKVSSVVKEAKGVADVLEKKAGQIQNTAQNAYADASKIVSKVPEFNETLIKQGNVIIKKSGGITDVLRKGAVVGDKIVQAGLQLGGKDIPVIGSALALAGKGSSRLAIGATKLDNVRDTAQKKLDKYSDVSRGTISDLEKMNQRKREEIARAGESVDMNFA
jgi:hypothetical protein